MTSRLATTLLCSALLVACSKSAEPATAAAPKKASTDTPDLSADYCKLMPPERIAEYTAAHGVFTSQAGVEPQFTKGQLFKDGDTIRFKWARAASQPLLLRKFLLKDCSERELGGSPLDETPPGSGEVSAVLHTSAAGSDYPDGTPGIVEVLTVENIDSTTMSGTTVVQGRYFVHFNGPKG